MERHHKLMLIGIVAVLVAVIISSFFGQSNIKAIQNNISMSQKNIDTAMTEIRSTKTALDSIQARISAFSDYVTSADKGVVDLNERKISNEAISASVVSALRKKASVLKADITKSDTLPEIKVKPL